MALLRFVTLLACVASSYQFDVDSLCEILDCNAFGHRALCGPDGVTYNNWCFANCAGINVREATLGRCEIVDNTAEPVDTEEPVEGCSLRPCARPPIGVDTRVCGNDGVTYASLCIFSYEQCLNADLNVVHEGPCDEEPQRRCGGFLNIRCPAGYECTNSVDCDPFTDCMGICEPTAEECGGECVMIYAPVCGTDGQTYVNECELNNAKCEKTELAIAYEGECVSKKSCGGVVGSLCPAGFECVDVPDDGCDPEEGGADCIGFCEQQETTRPTEALPEKACFLPKEVGPCRARIPRWYYNPQSGECEKFIYGGCEGNGNNFMTEAECEPKCERHEETSVPEDTAAPVETEAPAQDRACFLPKEVGPCKVLIPRWYYNPQSGECEEFFYGGCLGNDNNFMTEAACEPKCERHEETSAPEELIVDPPEELIVDPPEELIVDPPEGPIVEEECEGECAMIYAPVCGNDGQTYGNECEFNNAKCEKTDLVIAYEGECGSKQSCGGFVGSVCPAGFECVDVPNDGCHPEEGGADCIGFCEQRPQHRCGGFFKVPCPTGYECTNSVDCGPYPLIDCMDICEPTAGADEDVDDNTFVGHLDAALETGQATQTTAGIVGTGMTTIAILVAVGILVVVVVVVTVVALRRRSNKKVTADARDTVDDDVVLSLGQTKE